MRISLTSKQYADKTVLSDLELAVAPGEFVAVTGRSGVGKTTLLRILAGLDKSWQGHLDWEGVTGVGMMFQEPRLMPWLTALDNVTLVSSDRDAAREALERVGLGDSLNLYPVQLSGGMQRRVSMARALVNRPDFLIMDEPFASLDATSAQDCRKILVAQCRSMGAAVLFVTHDIDEAIDMADRLLIIAGRPATIVHEPSLPGPTSDDGKGIGRDALKKALSALVRDQ